MSAASAVIISDLPWVSGLRSPPIAEAGVRLFADIAIGDPLEFVDSKPYPSRLDAARKSSGRNDAVVVGTASIEEHPVALAIMDFEFMGGSMGVVVGEKLARLFDYALAKSLPVVLFAASGGARMQEGALSLMQMAKVSSAIARIRDARLPYHLGAMRSDNRRSRGVVCDAGRPQHFRARRADRICGPAGNQADHWRGSSCRIFSARNFSSRMGCLTRSCRAARCAPPSHAC